MRPIRAGRLAGALALAVVLAAGCNEKKDAKKGSDKGGAQAGSAQTAEAPPALNPLRQSAASAGSGEPGGLEAGIEGTAQSQRAAFDGDTRSLVNIPARGTVRGASGSSDKFADLPMREPRKIRVDSDGVPVPGTPTGSEFSGEVLSGMEDAALAKAQASAAGVSGSSGNPDGHGAAMEAIAALRRAKRTRSQSVGSPSNGRLKNGMYLPPDGYGYTYVKKSRGRTYGTDELVLGLMQVAADFQKMHPGDPGLKLGDLSQKGGGEVSHHASHESGVDVDIIFLAMDTGGKPVDHDKFLGFDSRGRRGSLRFDTARNWDLVSLLVSNPYFGSGIQYIFIDRHQKDALLSHARSLRDASSGSRRAELDRQIRAAAGVLRHWKNHSDHYHLRIKPNLPLHDPGPAAYVSAGSPNS